MPLYNKLQKKNNPYRCIFNPMYKEIQVLSLLKLKTPKKLKQYFDGISHPQEYVSN